MFVILLDLSGIISGVFFFLVILGLVSVSDNILQCIYSNIQTISLIFTLFIGIIVTITNALNDRLWKNYKGESVDKKSWQKLLDYLWVYSLYPVFLYITKHKGLANIDDMHVIAFSIILIFIILISNTYLHISYSHSVFDSICDILISIINWSLIAIFIGSLLFLYGYSIYRHIYIGNSNLLLQSIYGLTTLFGVLIFSISVIFYFKDVKKRTVKEIFIRTLLIMISIIILSVPAVFRIINNMEDSNIFYKFILIIQGVFFFMSLIITPLKLKDRCAS